MALEDDQARVLADIRKYGCHVLYVRGEGGQPPFAYTVGIGRAANAPDMVVFGQPHDVSHRLLHNYNQRVRRGERFEAGQSASGFLKDVDCRIRPVHESHHLELFGWNAWLHDGPRFQMLQLVYPTVEGIWPWDEMANAWLRNWQPLLESPAPGASH